MKLKKKFTSAQSQVIVIYFLRCLFKQKKAAIMFQRLTS